MRLLFAALFAAPFRVYSTSVKMDFLPLGDVRVDPIIHPTCLTDHVHTFYGAAYIRPEAKYEDLVGATGNSGNVEENPSLYWHPTVYRYEPATGIYNKVDIWFTSAYYVWETGKTQAWPNGFKMLARSPPNKDMVNDDETFGITHTKFECASPFPCERNDCSTTNAFFPATGCGELEVSFRFPSCWDGFNVDSSDHMSHVAYTENGEFDERCPDTHPVKIPQIRLYFRILGYEGGHHEFSDGTGIYHSDYFSGWNQDFLQRLLDECWNPSETASPDEFCEDILTFRGGQKHSGVQIDDEDIKSKLLKIQPEPPVDVTMITTEAIDNVQELPRGACTGELLPVSVSNSGSTPGPDPTTQPPTAECPKKKTKSQKNGRCVKKPWKDFEGCEQEAAHGVCEGPDGWWFKKHCCVSCASCVRPRPRRRKSGSSAPRPPARKLLRQRKPKRKDTKETRRSSLEKKGNLRSFSV